MDAFEALLRLQHAAGNPAWLRLALDHHAVESGHNAALSLLESPPGAAPGHTLPPGIAKAAAGRAAIEHAARVRQWLDGGAARSVLGWADPGYPSLLRQAASPPVVLFVEGQAERLWWPQIAIVGSRAPTPAGRERAARWAARFGAAGFVVTSGMATGIDAAAHGACLAAPGTVAVMATGPDRCYPTAHAGLKEAITREGCLVTEHAPGVDPRPEHFPSRNRLIAGLSLATVVVEAAHRSGALITARLAAEAGRDVFALPGSPENPKARGCHRLIRDGAVLADDPDQVLDAVLGAAAEAGGQLRLALQPATGPFDAHAVGSRTDDDATRRVLEALGDDGADIDELFGRCGLTSPSLAPILLALEMDGRLTQHHGRYLPCSSAPPTRAHSGRRR